MQSGERQNALERSRHGDLRALGALLESFRPYIRAVVHTLRDRRLQGRIDDSDLIQEVMLEAHRGFPGFRGSTVGELVGWLRQIIVGTAADMQRSFATAGKRDPGREEVIGEGFDLAGDTSSPSAQAIRHEQEDWLVRAVAQLPPDMRQVVVARHVEGLPYAAIAQRLGRSEAAARVLYVRALDRLRERCPE